MENTLLAAALGISEDDLDLASWSEFEPREFCVRINREFVVISVSAGSAGSAPVASLVRLHKRCLTFTTRRLGRLNGSDLSDKLAAELMEAEQKGYATDISVIAEARELAYV